jgi:hypothetical protein
MVSAVRMTKADLGLLIGLASLLLALGLSPTLVLTALVGFLVGRSWG